MINIAVCMALVDENDKDIFEQIYYNYEKKLFAFSMNILHNKSLAEDAVSETFFMFAKNYKKIYNLETSELLAYLIIINRNACYRIYNKESGNNNNILLDEYIETKEDTSSEDDFRGIDLTEILISVPEIYRDVFMMKNYYGFSANEIAKQTSLSVNQVNYRLDKARKLIKEELEKE